MLIKVTRLEGPVRADKGYRTLGVVYESDGREKTQRLVDFGATKPCFEVLLNAAPGDVYEITLQKNGEYWNWVSASAATKEASKTSAPATRSTYETPEERATRQLYIIRQSSVANALTLHAATKGVSLAQVLETAEGIVQYVLNGPTKTAGKMPELTDDINWPK
jgi:hypothetical protein